MIIAADQMRSEAGDIAAIPLAASIEAELIVLPALSLTGNEPTLVDARALDLVDERLEVFRDASVKPQITTGVGIPARTAGKPGISQAFFPGDYPFAATSLGLARVIAKPNFPCDSSRKEQPRQYRQ